MRDSPAVFLNSDPGDAEMSNDVGSETQGKFSAFYMQSIIIFNKSGANMDLFPGETQESEGIVTLERNSFNFFG